MNPNILYEDDQLLVCRKPAGVPVQSRQIGVMDLESSLKNYLALKEKSGQAPYLGLIHRLDQPVEGILCFARTPSAAASLSGQLTDGTMRKYYLAVTTAVPAHPAGTLTDYLIKDGRKNLSAVVSPTAKGAKKSILSYQVLAVQGSNALLEIQLKTGRHHQIRVQLSHAGFPLWGDTKYNPMAAAAGEWLQIALCAYRLEFRHPDTGKDMAFKITPDNEVFRPFQVRHTI
ncbi:RluA family pseudouridine synthase [Lachnospiraceae bacterium ASD3451]|uniref:RluA family pseudouridine synthase n=1 Tax=Diplocloster agilis TaxID=2850323 RepID=UPI001DE49861|nr:RluA family pseudouridine synthase [Diplocloster agilis]MBU9743537.1 RluA family pseudouridine synthase [Diplocloster agilis]